MNNIDLHKHNFVIRISEDIPYSAKKLLGIFKLIVPNAKGGGNDKLVGGVYYDTEGGYYLSFYNKVLYALIDGELL